MWKSMTLFVNIIVSTKVILYLSSWATTSLNDMVAANSSKTFFSLQIWRLVTAPLATDSFFDILVVLPFYIIKILYPSETLKGTATSMIEFIIQSTIFVFVFSIVSLPLGPHGNYVCGLMALNIIDICVWLSQEPEKEADLCIIKVSNKILGFIILAFCWLFMGNPISIIIAIAVTAYINPLRYVGEERISFLSQKLESAISKIPSTVTNEQAKVNASMSTDSYEPFDRTKVKGRVSQTIKQSSSSSSLFENASTRPSSSASSISPSSGGVIIGGERQRDDSNLLNLSISEQIQPQVFTSEEIQEDHQIGIGSGDFKITGLDDIRFN